MPGGEVELRDVCNEQPADLNTYSARRKSNVMYRMKTKLYYSIVALVVVYILYRLLQPAVVWKNGDHSRTHESEFPRRSILIIGVGNIGLRHFQSVLELEDAVDITVVDTSGSALKRALELHETKSSKNIHTRVFFIPSLNGIAMGTQFDVGIIATTSSVRRIVIEDVLMCCQLRYVILEKVLFQTTEDHIEVQKLFQKHDVTVYVNALWSSIPLAKYLKEKFQPPVNILVQGSNWGLCCNALHFFALAAYLNDWPTDLSIDGTLLTPGYQPAKRKGYVEIFGELSGKFKLPNGEANIRTECGQGDTAPDDRVFVVWNDKGEIAWSQKTGLLRGSFTNEKYSKSSESETFTLPMVSEWTHLMVFQLLTTGECDLPLYEDVFEISIKLTEVFLSHLSEAGNEAAREGVCLIT